MQPAAMHVAGDSDDRDPHGARTEAPLPKAKRLPSGPIRPVAISEALADTATGGRCASLIAKNLPCTRAPWGLKKPGDTTSRVASICSEGGRARDLPAQRARRRRIAEEEIADQRGSFTPARSHALQLIELPELRGLGKARGGVDAQVSTLRYEARIHAARRRDRSRPAPASSNGQRALHHHQAAAVRRHGCRTSAAAAQRFLRSTRGNHAGHSPARRAVGLAIDAAATTSIKRNFTRRGDLLGASLCSAHAGVSRPDPRYARDGGEHPGLDHELAKQAAPARLHRGADHDALAPSARGGTALPRDGDPARSQRRRAARAAVSDVRRRDSPAG